MDLKKIKELVAILEDSKLQKMVIEDKSISIKLSKPESGKVLAKETSVTFQSPPAEGHFIQNHGIESPAASLYQSSDSSIENEIRDDTINSPMVGTFYAAPAPGSQPFVVAGKEVAKGDVVCIVEAMKMMNQIKADKSGKIGSVLIEDGEPVEYGQPLMTII